MKSEVINLPNFDLAFDRVKEVIEHYWELQENKLIAVFNGYLDKHPSDEDSLGIVKTDQYINCIDYVKKDAIYNVQTRFHISDSGEEYNVWVLSVFYGTNDVYCNFKTEEEARGAERKVMEWLQW